MTEVEKASNFVERFACSVVDGLANNGVFAVRNHVDEQCVAARHQHHQHRKLHQRVVQERRIQMRLQVIDTNEWFVEHKRNRLCSSNTNQQCAHEAWPNSCSNGIDAFERNARIRHCLAHNGRHCFHVCTAGNFGHHPTKSGVLFNLRGNHRGQNIVAAHHHRRGRFVATCFDAKYDG